MTTTFMRRAMASIALALIGCGALAQSQPSEPAGAYLAARSAGAANDFGAASDWFLAALAADPTNANLIDSSLLALVSLGDFDRASDVADMALTAGIDSQLASMVQMTAQAQAGDWTALHAGADTVSVSARINTFAAAWAMIGAGEIDAALAAFDAAATEGVEAYAMYHKAMALAAIGRFEQAEALFATEVPRTRRSVIARAQLLSNIGQIDAADGLLDGAFGANKDPAVLAMSHSLDAGRSIPFTIVTTAQEGIAEIFHTEASSFASDSPPEIVLLYAQVARALHADDPEIIMMSAGLLEELGRYAQAGETYAQVSAQSPVFHSAEFGRANVLFAAGRAQEAIDVLENIVAGFPQLAMAHAELGDIHRSLRQMDQANAAYSAALDLVPPSDGRHWVLRYKRGITFHQIDDWAAAETDLRVALDQNPGNAGLLNYLGYSMVERGENLQEALGMIEQAVSAEPESGAIVDSYGWALYTLGRYEEAVVPMELAAQLLPEDAVINDHLGDVYFAVGRRLEAEFQWRRALSYTDDAEKIALILQKLENGLEVAMTEEDEPPIEAAQDL